MLYQDLTYDEVQNKKRGIYATVFFHIIALLLLLMPFFSYEYPKKEASGILIALGFQEAGSFDEAVNQQDTRVTETNPQQDPSENKPIVAQEKSAEPTEAKVTQSATPSEKVTTSQNSEVVVATQKSKADLKRAQEEAKATAKKNAEEALTRENARKKAEEEAEKQAEFEKSKQQYGNLLGKGKGNNNAPGNQGSTEGDPNADVLKALATGSGRIGGGLSSRGVLSEPNIVDNTNKVGKVVINVCVDTKGKVTSARFTQRGSTTTDTHLVEIARKGALKYVFSPAEVESQCGTVTVDFKVQ